MQPDEKAIYIYRRRFADDDPIVIEMIYLSFGKCGFVIRHDITNESLLNVIAHHNETRIIMLHRQIEAEEASEHDILTCM